MTELLLSDLSARVIFTLRGDAVRGDMRLTWRLAVLLAILHICGRGGRASFAKLHLLSWVVRDSDAWEEFLKIILIRGNQLYPIVRFEPALIRAVNFAVGQGLAEIINGNRIQITKKGTEIAEEIENAENCLEGEVDFLRRVGKQATEQVVSKLMQAEFHS